MKFNEELNAIGTNNREERQTDWLIKTWSRRQSTRCFNDWLFLGWFLVFEPNKNKWKAILFSIFALHRDKTHCFLETGTPRGIFVFIGDIRHSLPQKIRHAPMALSCPPLFCALPSLYHIFGTVDQHFGTGSQLYGTDYSCFFGTN